MNADAAVPVLLYHSVRAAPTPGYERWETSPERLRDNLDRLDASGRRVVPLAAYARWVRGEAVALADRPVVITFDDGFANFLDLVPLLLERSCAVTMFVPTAYIGGESTWLAPRFRRAMLTWSQIVELDAAGVEIGSHAHLHRPIDTLPVGAVRAEIIRSRGLIEEHLGHACASFAYPHGYSSPALRRAVAAAGFAQACAVRDAMSGRDDDPMAIARLFVGWDDVGDRFDGILTRDHHAPLFRERIATRGWRVTRRVRSRLARPDRAR